MFSLSNSDLTKYINEQVLPKFEFDVHFEHWIGEPVQKKDQELRFFTTQEGRFFALYNENFWGSFEEVRDCIQEHGFTFQEFIPVQFDHRIIKSDDDVVTFEQMDPETDMSAALQGNLEEEFIEEIASFELVDEEGNTVELEDDDFNLSADDLAEDRLFRSMCARFLYETSEGQLPQGISTQYVVLAEVRPRLSILRN